MDGVEIKKNEMDDEIISLNNILFCSCHTVQWCRNFLYKRIRRYNDPSNKSISSHLRERTEYYVCFVEADVMFNSV